MKKRLYWINILICSFCFAISSCGKATEKEMISLKEKVICIECENQRGSGVVYAQNGEQVIIVTAAHVIEGSENIMAGQNIVSEVMRMDGLDMAFMKIENAVADEAVADDIKEKKSESLDTILLQGYDKSGDFKECIGKVNYDWIYVEDFQNHMMIIEAAAESGMSGGGVFDKNGVFLGIICGIDESENVAVLPAEVIASEYSVLFADQ